jgi:hypothetical protein
VTEYERARLRLKCWQMLNQHSYPYNPGEETVGGSTVTTRRALSWDERQQWAERLFEWTIAPPAKEPTP